jgi:hypothetical protein
VTSGMERSEKETIITPEFPGRPDEAGQDMLTPEDETEPGPEREPEIQLQDAYARYEQFLAQSKSRPNWSRTDSGVRPPSSYVLSPQQTGAGPSPSPTPTSPSATPTSTVGSLPHAGRFSGFFSRMMAPSSSHDKRTTPVISGPITRVDPIDREQSDSPLGGGVAEESEFGKTWGSLVEPSVLETMTSRERKRQEVSAREFRLSKTKSPCSLGDIRVHRY